MAELSISRNRPAVKPRVIALLERIDRTLVDIMLQDPTSRQLNTIIERLANIEDALDRLVEGREAFTQAAEALTEAVERLQRLNINARNIQIYGDEAKVWPRGDVHLEGRSNNGAKPQDSGQSSADRLRQHLERHRGVQNEEE